MTDWQDTWVRPPTVPMLWGGAILSALVLSVPAYSLVWFWPGVQRGATCDLVHQPFCHLGYGLPQWYAVAGACVAACALQVATFARRRRPVARWLSGCGLASAVLAWLLTTVARPWLSGHVPSSWFMA